MKISLPPDLLAQLPWPENEEATGKKIYLKSFFPSLPYNCGVLILNISIAIEQSEVEVIK